ncbi:pseudouridylate synthase 3 [Niveomyces insectorum RCEF 264]|uniref:Pseudouridylate synthase 3 n=1 Tax=Niveomyces insectorum RCEF 264 TaxID=1081102 RepID=A0A162MNN9_9HYPO|nr:pseudouridylate synthase 3 [Niveomyces insectorum RCEF 264]
MRFLQWQRYNHSSNLSRLSARQQQHRAYSYVGGEGGLVGAGGRTRRGAGPVVVLPRRSSSSSSSSSARAMADYGRWTKEALVRRVQALEQQLAVQEAQQTAGGDDRIALSPAPTPPPPPPQPSSPKKAAKAPDPAKYATRYVALKIAYLGKRYGGFEYQPSGALPTVEEELWKALVRTCLVFPPPVPSTDRDGGGGGLSPADLVDFSICDYSKCGRTDRGVSAFGQVVALRLRSNGKVRSRRRAGEEMTGSGGGGGGGSGSGAEAEDDDNGNSNDPQQMPPPDEEIQYGKVLNRMLPPDIRVLAWSLSLPDGFSARFSCRERQYRYFFTQPAYFGAPPAVHGDDGGDGDRGPRDGWLDIAAMRAAAHHFVGVHDFRNFCKVDATKQITNFVRQIFDADIVEVPDVHSSLAYYHRHHHHSADNAGTVAGGGGSGSDGRGGPKVYAFTVRGSAFLWHQIRHMVAVLFLVGQGREAASVVPALLDVAANPGRPPYAMAEETPLVLWDCIFPPLDPNDTLLKRQTRNGDDNNNDDDDDGGSSSSDIDNAVDDAPAAGDWSDSLAWIATDEHGAPSRMFVDGLWRQWRAAKMDELLANRLLDVVLTRYPPRTMTSGSGSGSGSNSNKNNKSLLFEGGDGPRMGGAYVPLLQRQRMASPEELNDKFARQKGFASADAMREVGNWRAAIRAQKATAAEAAAGPGAGGVDDPSAEKEQ